jgi:hypothetical protein
MPKGYKGREKSKRLHMLIAPDELATIDDWRFKNRIATRAEAIRRLVQIGLLFDRHIDEILSTGRVVGRGLQSINCESLTTLFEIEDIDELRARIASVFASAAPIIEEQDRLLRMLRDVIVPVLEMKIEIVAQPFDELETYLNGLQDEVNRKISDYERRKLEGGKS